jgi:hypothetical protein
MRYNKAYEYFDKKEQGLIELLEDCQDMITSINEYRRDFMANIYSSADEYDEAMIKLTGIYMYIVEIFEAAQAAKEIEEDAALLRFKNEATSKGEKTTDTVLKTMAHAHIAQYIKIRNTFEAYVSGCEKAISTCQSKLKKFDKDWGGKQKG